MRCFKNCGGFLYGALLFAAGMLVGVLFPIAPLLLIITPLAAAFFSASHRC